MTSPLFPCPRCMRHVRLGGATCPFCACELSANPEGIVPAAPSGALSRAALFVFATTVAACSSSQPAATQNVVAQEPATTVTAAQDASSSTPSSGGSVVETPADPGPGAIAAMYGAPVMLDASTMTADAASAPSDTPSADVATADARADASRPDAGRVRPLPPVRPPVDHGAIMVRYGSPPADFA